MSAEQLPPPKYEHGSYEEYAHDTFYTELVRMQNNDGWTAETIFINGSFQELYAEGLVMNLRQITYFRRFGGKTLSIVMVPSGEPYMYNIGLQVAI